MNKAKIAAVATLVAALSTSYLPAFAVETGNGAPSGAHYNLNIIGVPKDKTADMTGDNGHRIFVKLEGKTKIMLAEGDDYQVTDANGTDGTAAFTLPNPDPEGDGVTVYSVYARALGKPGGSAIVTTCAYDVGDDGVLGTADDVLVCSTEQLTVTRTKGKSSFDNVSRELLYIYEDVDGDDDLELVPLFDDRLEGYFWDYDNTGLKVLQLRFYPISTNVN